MSRLVVNLSKLFSMQRELDEKIVREKNLHDLDRLPYLKLALLVELGELANEWRGFKFWSNDRKPRREKILEEYVDCLHFILSIGLLLQVPEDQEFDYLGRVYSDEWIIHTFRLIFYGVTQIEGRSGWHHVTEEFISLGESLGLTWDEIEQAYIQKNVVNHQRQENGY